MHCTFICKVKPTLNCLVSMLRTFMLEKQSNHKSPGVKFNQSRPILSSSVKYLNVRTIHETVAGIRIYMFISPYQLKKKTQIKTPHISPQHCTVGHNHIMYCKIQQKRRSCFNMLAAYLASPSSCKY